MVVDFGWVLIGFTLIYGLKVFASVITPTPITWEPRRARKIREFIERDKAWHLSVLEKTPFFRQFMSFQECPKCRKTHWHWIEKIHNDNSITRKCRECGHEWIQE